MTPWRHRPERQSIKHPDRFKAKAVITDEKADKKSVWHGRQAAQMSYVGTCKNAYSDKNFSPRPGRAEELKRSPR